MIYSTLATREEVRTAMISRSVRSIARLGGLGGGAPSASAISRAACTTCGGSFWKFSRVIV